MGKIESKQPAPDIPKKISTWWERLQKKPPAPTMTIPNMNFNFPTLWGRRESKLPDPDIPSIFSTLWRTPNNPNDFVPLFTDCVGIAAARTQEYLLFLDPEDKFQPSPSALNDIFLMTYITQSSHLHMTDSFNCTTMTKQQRILLGADWVWAVLERPTKNPRVQIAVQILHLPERGGGPAEDIPPEVYTESMQMAKMESAHKNKAERMVDFCASIGNDCYALFLLFGRKGDPGNIYGVLSNNFHAAIGKTKINRALIENFFKGSRYLHTPTGMLQAIVTKRDSDPLTLLIKFT
nr:rab15 effector protein [Oncorhynchus nerka]